MRLLVMLGVVIGSTIGGYIPSFWGGSIFSMASLLFSFIGGVIGIWAGYKIAIKIGL